ncbi:MAG: NAD-dependent epimerase/dehydratase family protein [Actinobacteria bacterium]|nr:NAD-dependent epimerase/dehydratase family protein [Actinomycetota bacterium]
MTAPAHAEHAVVTGVAGFIGSTLATNLIDRGWVVRGIDCFTPYYDERIKHANLALLRERPGFSFADVNLCHDDIKDTFNGADVVFHLAGQPGVRLSWDEGFPTYLDLNVLATQRVLEALRRQTNTRLVYASSSSVYGNTDTVPTPESQLPRPFSPYGVTKLAGEHLCLAYAENHGVSARVLRYFTVYGPRQRPDMALHRMIVSALNGDAFSLFGDGSQVRDFTYVDDVVEATIAAGLSADASGHVINVAGGGSTTMTELVEIVGDAVGRPLRIETQPAQSGDVRATGGDTRLAHSVLGWRPMIDVREGVRRQTAWHRSRPR